MQKKEKKIKNTYETTIKYICLIKKRHMKTKENT